MAGLADETTFRNSARAGIEFEHLRTLVPPGILQRLQRQISASAHPDGALHWISNLARDKPEAFHRISRRPLLLQNYVTVFSHSSFLARDLCQHPELLEAMLHDPGLEAPLTPELCRILLSRAVDSLPTSDLAQALAAFRRRQYLRILLRDVTGKTALAETTAELSHVADAILDAAYCRIRAELEVRHGSPRLDDAVGGACGMSVLALGKLGGEELNYSSDIDLMFVYSGNGDTSGPEVISNKEFFKKLANAYTALLSAHTADGLCYRVDLRLRPEGRLGEVAISLEGARHYYRHRARDWELQMLIKARVAAGEKNPGQQVLDFVEPLIYSTTLDFKAVEGVSEARLRIHEKALKKTGSFDVKLLPGGIRDIEFLVQCLQRLHGGREPWVRHGGTLLALARLSDKKLLSPGEYSELASAYEFLRHLEHRLQLVDDRQTHALPSSSSDLDVLARRMGAYEVAGVPSAAQLLEHTKGMLARVRQLYERVIHAQRPVYYGLLVDGEDLQEILPSAEPDEVTPVSSNLVRFLDQTAPDLAAVVAQRPLQRNGPLFERFLHEMARSPAQLQALSADSTAAMHVMDIFEHSQWLADALNRNPESALALRDLDRGRDVRAPMWSAARSPSAMRQHFHAGVFRIMAESLCLQRPIFETLLKTSALADAAIEASYRTAVHYVQASSPPRDGYKPHNQMMVIALGRLGMLEFDLASDADLIFVLPDRDEGELDFWTRVAERLIDVLSAYTGDGTVFAVDTRLRAGGRDGTLVQLERSYQDYFATRAEAWEGIAYMKARGVAGDLQRATSFLTELQRLDWRQYGQSGRSRQQLAQMRVRIEKEQGAANPLKAGPGGYYDIDFALMYLRLRGAGIFYKALNTPQRIDIVEQMGHLERADANFLRDAATFFRAIDHGIRLQTGHAAGKLPVSSARLKQLMEMIRRWTPAHLHDQTLASELAQIQTRTRECFERLFAA